MLNRNDPDFIEKAEDDMNDHVDETGHKCCRDIFVLITAGRARSEAYFARTQIVGKDEEFIGVCFDCKSQVPGWPPMDKQTLKLWFG